MLILLGHFLFYNLLIIQANKGSAQEVKLSRNKVQSMPITMLQCLVTDTVFGNADFLGESKYLLLPTITKLEIKEIRETASPNTFL